MPMLLATSLLTLVMSLPNADHHLPLRRVASGTDPTLGVLSYRAQIEAVVEACTADDVSMSGHLLSAFDDWLVRNPAVSEPLDTPPPGPESEQAAALRLQYEELKQQFRFLLDQERSKDQARFSGLCNDFTKRLYSGELDYDRPMERAQ